MWKIDFSHGKFVLTPKFADLVRMEDLYDAKFRIIFTISSRANDSRKRIHRVFRRLLIGQFYFLKQSDTAIFLVFGSFLDNMDRLLWSVCGDEKYKDHALKGDWDGFRECHIQPDWLLIYLVEDDSMKENNKKDFIK